jgi:hypothetical protein
MGHKFNITPDERQRLDAFRRDRYWLEWQRTLHPNTRNTYTSHLFKLLGLVGVTPSELIAEASNPETAKELSKRVKLAFAELAKTYSASAQHNSLSALKHLLALNELELSLIGLKIRTQRKVRPLMTWQESERVITLCNVEYQPVYRFMRAAAMDQERFTRLNGNQDRIDAIKRQLKDPTRDWIRVDVPEGRKNAPGFYCLIPRGIAELLPVLDQQGQPILVKNNIANNWRNAMHRAGFTGPEYRRFGAHNLRSVWLSEAQRRKLDPVLMQHQLGHTVDALNYQRIQQDTQWAIREFRKAWETQPLVTEGELATRDKQIKDLETRLHHLEAIETERVVLAEPRKQRRSKAGSSGVSRRPRRSA